MEDYDLAGPLEEWRALRDEVREEVLEQGVRRKRGTFVQHYGTRAVDASLLILPLVGFIDGDDPWMLGTIRAIEEDLLHEGLLLRYRTETGVDGLSGDEHPSSPARSGWCRRTPRRAGSRRRTPCSTGWWALRNDVGLLAEEYDPVRQRMVGNFPQAFSHLALVRAAFYLAEADERAAVSSPDVHRDVSDSHRAPPVAFDHGGRDWRSPSFPEELPCPSPVAVS